MKLQHLHESSTLSEARLLDLLNSITDRLSSAYSEAERTGDFQQFLSGGIEQAISTAAHAGDAKQVQGARRYAKKEIAKFKRKAMQQFGLEESDWEQQVGNIWRRFNVGSI